jgi:hypothetical protein
MASATGKAARKAGGNKYTVGRMRSATRKGHKFDNSVLAPEAYRGKKAAHRKEQK